MKNNLPATNEDLKKALSNLVTKTDAKQFLTKEDAKKFATKIELKSEIAKLATKIELKSEIAKLDKNLRLVIRITADETKKEIREEIKQSTSKILDVLDNFMGEIKTSEEERIISSHRLSDHEDRIEVLEEKVGIVSV